MKVLVNNKLVNIPSALSEITLKQRIDYQLEVGSILDEMYKSVMEIPDEIDRELELIQFNLERVFRTIAFFANCSIEAVKEYEDIETLINLFSVTTFQLFEEEQKIKLDPEFTFLWGEDYWYIDVPELKNGSKISFGEFIDSKQVIQDMVKLGRNRWECLLPLCVIFLRKENEQYEESFLYEGSDRLKLMESLPLSIAIQVGFFLMNSLNSYINSSLYFTPQELKGQENIQKSISKDLVG